MSTPGETALTATNLVTSGVHEADHGVAGALVNTTQQVGGAAGIALLSTLSGSATSSYIASHGHGPAVLEHAAIYGYSVAYAVAAGIFVGGAVLGAVLYRNGIPEEIRSGEIPIAV